MNNGDYQITGECINQNDPLWAAAKEGGLTKREYFAGLAMQGLLSGVSAAQGPAEYHGWNPKDFAEEAVTQAGALLKELDK